MPVHLTKVAFGHDSVEDLRRALSRYRPGEFWLTTRYLPKRHEDVVGGSLFWILRHQLVARTPITGFGELPTGKTAIYCDPVVIDVRPQPKRAHQGWRYLEDADAPADLGGGANGIADLPPKLLGALSELALI
ncbi:DUF1489 family protein [Stakelama tenebrarum]|uniref:DUF1489 domain-containing protein n=1 Tax=Stakelama tenebrarum TaxID=2711215 RepID=A0A6G6Y0T6_9SPHN|nr:DUF1489 domain-containing protein [Sphingosinithalassobacter tenebrarum]QIG78520.1 DUF1489 domain-containing protein [Sphingosinithalassobacter tenebrarum]